VGLLKPKILSPTSIWIQSEVKFFTLNRGSDDPGTTDGSAVSITFEVAEGTSMHDLRVAMFDEKRRLDLAVLSMERMKGVVPNNVYNLRAEAIKKNYDNAMANLKPAEASDS